jgi:hypothetical protein
MRPEALASVDNASVADPSRLRQLDVAVLND